MGGGGAAASAPRGYPLFSIFWKGINEYFLLCAVIMRASYIPASFPEASRVFGQQSVKVETHAGVRRGAGTRHRAHYDEHTTQRALILSSSTLLFLPQADDANKGADDRQAKHKQCSWYCQSVKSIGKQIVEPFHLWIDKRSDYDPSRVVDINHHGCGESSDPKEAVLHPMVSTTRAQPRSVLRREFTAKFLIHTISQEC